MGIRSGRLHIDTSNIGKVYDTNGEAMVDVWIGSQAEYDAIDPKDANTLYLIEEAVE